MLWVEVSVRETAVFGDNILMTRRIWTRLNEPHFWVDDRVENQSFAPAPHMFVQHINLGFPLVDSTIRLELPDHVTQPRNDDAQAGLEKCCEFTEPIDDYREQVFYHDLKPDAQGQVEVCLVNPAFDDGRGLGVVLRYAKADYPVLVEWKMMGEGIYVVGVELSNCYLGGRCQERKLGRLITLAPREVRTYRLEIEFLRRSSP